MGNPLPPRRSFEWDAEKGINFPKPAFEARSTLPSYADADHATAIIEPFTVTIPVSALASGASSTLTKTQGLTKIQNLRLASYDIGYILVSNIAYTAPANCLVSHIAPQVVTNQGNPLIGVLQSGSSYTGVAIQVSATIYATGATTAGNLVVTGTALLMGSATS